MNPTVSTGVAMIGGVGLQPSVQDALSDIWSWLHVVPHLASTFHANSWAVLLLAGIGAWLHTNRGTTP